MMNIVILGASYAGICTAHRLLKQSTKTKPFKITIVSPNTHFYWSMAAPRGLVPGKFTTDQLFQPIVTGFEKYARDQFEFIVGSAKSLDVENKVIVVSNSFGERLLQYDFLVLATGSRYKGDIPLKGLGSTEATMEALRDFQGQVKKAKTIAVAGAGVTGCEVAGELAHEYGETKKIVLVASGPFPVEESPPSVSDLVLKALRDLKVTIKLSTKVIASTSLPSGEQELCFDDGSTLLADMYVPTFGLTANSSYIPTKFLNAKGFVVVDEHLNVKGTKDVWAIGDVSSAEASTFIYCDKQSAYLAKTLIGVLKNDLPVQKPYKVATNLFMGLSIGKKAGTGHWGNMRIPSFVVITMRKNLFTERLRGTVDGSKLF